MREVYIMVLSPPRLFHGPLIFNQPERQASTVMSLLQAFYQALD